MNGSFAIINLERFNLSCEGRVLVMFEGFFVCLLSQWNTRWGSIGDGSTEREKTE